MCASGQSAFSAACFSASLLCALTLLLAPTSGWSEVRILGIDEALAANARAHLRLDDEDCEQPEPRIRYRFRNAERELRDALEPFGHYQSSITSELTFNEADCWLATFEIDPGPRMMVSRAELAIVGEGAEFPKLLSVLTATTITEGQPLDHAAYDDLKTRLSVTAREYGYLEARFTRNRLIIDRQENLAEIELELTTGPRFRFGKLNIKTDTLNGALIRRYLNFAEGQPFEQRALRKLQNDLQRGEYFSDISITQTRRDDHSVDIDLELTEGRRIRYGIGIGYGTDTGVVVRGDWVNRWVNRRGHRLQLDAQIAQVLGDLTFDYRIPSKKPQSDWYSVYGGYSWRDTDAIESKTRKVGVSEVRVHSNRWRSQRFIEFSVEDYREDEWQQRTHLVPGYSLTYQTSNAADRPTRGLRLTAEVLGASDYLISDSSFASLRLNGKVILPMGSKARLLLRGESGWMATEDFSRVPPSYRFYAGGDSSVRGYEYQSLGEEDRRGDAIGGRRVITGSIEADWRLTGAWSLAMFTDAGNVGDIGDRDLIEDLPWSVGVGVRWYSPIGPLRLDLAFPQQGDDSFRFHVSMGPDL